MEPVDGLARRGPQPDVDARAGRLTGDHPDLGGAARRPPADRLDRAVVLLLVHQFGESFQPERRERGLVAPQRRVQLAPGNGDRLEAGPGLVHLAHSSLATPAILAILGR